MKEIQSQEKDRVVIQKQAQQKKETKFIGRIKPHRGHTLYEVNLITGEIQPATFEPQVVTFDGKPQPKKVMVNKGCTYIPALNVKNLIKKLQKAGLVE